MKIATTEEINKLISSKKPNDEFLIGQLDQAAESSNLKYMSQFLYSEFVSECLSRGSINRLLPKYIEQMISLGIAIGISIAEYRNSNGNLDN